MDGSSIGALSQDAVGASLLVYLVALSLLGVDLFARIGASRTRRAALTATRAVAVPAAGAGGAPRGDGDLRTDDGEGPPADLGAVDASVAAAVEGRLSRADRFYRSGVAVAVLGTIVLAAGVVLRAVAVDRAPWGNMYEFSITGALVAALALLVLLRRPVGRLLAVWTVALVTLTLGIAVSALYVPPGELVPALRHYWLTLHVGAVVLAFGLFSLAAVTSVLQIVAQRRARRLVAAGAPLDGEGAGARSAVLPSSSALDLVSYRLVAIAFPLWTLGSLIMGPIWAEISWGRYWGWDPKEVWALISWLVYAGYLHARATGGWRGTRASVVCLVGFVTVLFSYYGVNIFFGGLHAYGGL